MLKLNIDLPSVDTSIPVLPSGKYPCRIAEVAVEESKNTPGNHNLIIDFRTLTSTDGLKPGTTCNENYLIRKWYPLQQSPNPKAPPFERDITLLFLAAFSDAAQEDLPTIQTEEDFKLLLNKEVMVEVGVEDSDDFGTRNNVKRVHPL